MGVNEVFPRLSIFVRYSTVLGVVSAIHQTNRSLCVIGSRETVLRASRVFLESCHVCFEHTQYRMNSKPIYLFCTCVYFRWFDSTSSWTFLSDMCLLQESVPRFSSTCFANSIEYFFVSICAPIIPRIDCFPCHDSNAKDKDQIFVISRLSALCV